LLVASAAGEAAQGKSQGKNLRNGAR